jgi:hypothetical protein
MNIPPKFLIGFVIVASTALIGFWWNSTDRSTSAGTKKQPIAAVIQAPERPASPEASRVPELLRAVDKGINIPEYTRKLLASAAPDDWYRAWAIKMQCAASAKIEGIDITSGAPKEHVKVIESTRDRCGFMGDYTTSEEAFTNVRSKARSAGSLYAARPDWNADKELTGTQWDALRSAVMHADGAEVWLLSNNISKLTVALGRQQEFSSYKVHETISALVLGLCAGTECSANNMMNHSLCSQTFGAVCSDQGIKVATSNAFGPEKAQRLQDLGEQIIYLLRQGEFERLGFRRKSGS